MGSSYINHFLQPDTLVPNIQNPQTWNRYSYAANNPILYNDPDGHCGPLCVIGLVGIFFILNSTSDTQQNLSPEEAESRQVSFAIGVSALSVSNPLVEHLSNIADCVSGAYCSPDSLAIPGSISAYRKHINEDSLDDVFVNVSPSKYDVSIDSNGLSLKYSQEQQKRIWLTKLGDIKDIDIAAEFETILYKKSLWETKSGSFSSGATIREIDISQLEIKPIRTAGQGMTNLTNGVRQWYIPKSIPPSALKVIRRINGRNVR